MKNHQKTNNYLVQVESHLNINQKKLLNYFYQPLVGTAALSFYYFLLEEEQFLKSVNFNLKLERIYQFLNLDARNLEINVEILIKHNLLEVYNWNEINKPEIDRIIFCLKAPLSVTGFLKSNFFSFFQTKVNNDLLEQIYFWLRPTQFINFVAKTNITNQSDLDKNRFSLTKKNSSAKKQLKDNSQKKIFDFLTSIESLQIVSYQPKMQDIVMIENLWKKSVSSDIIKIILDFMVFKINAFSYNYFVKLVTTLTKKNILTNLAKVENFFQILYQQMSFKNLEKEKRYFPVWLKKPSKNEIIKPNVDEKFSSSKLNFSSFLDPKQFNDLF